VVISKLQFILANFLFPIKEINPNALFKLHKGTEEIKKQEENMMPFQINKPGDTHGGTITKIIANPPSNVMEKERMNSNNRWLIKYTLGKMDTDAMTMMMHGELYVPLQANFQNQEDLVRIHRSFTFPFGLDTIINKKCINWSTIWWIDSQKNLLIPDFLKDKVTVAKGVSGTIVDNSLHFEVSWENSKITGITGMRNVEEKNTVVDWSFEFPAKHFHLFTLWCGYIFDQFATKVLPASEIESNNQI